MPNLLSVNSYHHVRGGSDAVYFNHARMMERQGWSNSFFSMRHPKNEPCETEAHFADRIDFEDRRGAWSTAVSAARIIYSRQAQERLSNLLDVRPADVAHYHCIYHHLSPSVLVEAKRRRIPTVMTAHDLKLACPNYKMMTHDGVCERCKGGKVWNASIHRCIKGSTAASALVAIESAAHKSLGLYRNNIDHIIAPSQFYRQKLIEWGWDPSVITYIPNCINHLPDRAPPPGNYLLYFGRLAPEKGLSTLIQAAKAANTPVKIAGTGPEEEKLRSLSADLDAPVQFLGFKSGKDLWELVDGARAIILPSEWYENGPMSVLEAFARGKPLIGASIGGIPELIEQDESGWSFEPGNVTELAALLAQVQSLPSHELSRMAEATRALVRSRFSQATYLAAILNLYRRLGVKC